MPRTRVPRSSRKTTDESLCNSSEQLRPNIQQSGDRLEEETKEAPPSPTKTIKATESSRGSANDGDCTTENIQIGDIIDQALIKTNNFIRKKKKDMKSVLYNPNFSDASNSRKRSKLQLEILAQYFQEDPKWKSQTYMKVAQAIGISPTQAYKWGYHYKIKQSKSKAKKRGRKAKPKRNNRVRPSKQSKANIKVLKTNSTRKVDLINETSQAKNSLLNKSFAVNLENEVVDLEFKDDCMQIDDICPDEVHYNTSKINEICSLDFIINSDSPIFSDCKIEEFCLPIFEESKPVSSKIDAAWMDLIFSKNFD